MPYVDAEVQADVASRSMLKDAFVKLHDSKDLYRLYGGQFKAPLLQRELESSWDLPLIWRGLVDDYLVDRNQLGGRRLGAMAEAKAKWMRSTMTSARFSSLE